MSVWSKGISQAAQTWFENFFEGAGTCNFLQLCGGGLVAGRWDDKYNELSTC